MKIAFRIIVVSLAALSFIPFICIGNVYAEVFPTAPWNGMQINYTITGAHIVKSDEKPGFTFQRTLTIDGFDRGATNLTVSGTMKIVNGYGASAVVTVSAGDNKKSETYKVDLNQPKNFSVQVSIPANATKGNISISMSGSYNAGSRDLVVTGQWTLTTTSTTSSTTTSTTSSITPQRTSQSNNAPPTPPTNRPASTPPQSNNTPPTPSTNRLRESAMLASHLCNNFLQIMANVKSLQGDLNRTMEDLKSPAYGFQGGFAIDSDLVKRQTELRKSLEHEKSKMEHIRIKWKEESLYVNYGKNLTDDTAQSLCDHVKQDADWYSSH